MSKTITNQLVKDAKRIVKESSSTLVENTSVEKIARLQDRLAEVLKLKNMKSIRLSELTGIPKGAISYYLNGKSLPKSDRLRLISQALNISETWLLGYNVSMERQVMVETLDDIEKNVERDSKTFDFCVSKAIDILLELNIAEETTKQQILKHFDIRYSEVTAILKCKEKDQTIDWIVER